MSRGSEADIKYLKLKMQLYIVSEEYEKAAELKQWIIELGGNPEIENIKEILKNKERKHGK
jgi:protein-arginine kinase activator protein McsA